MLLRITDWPDFEPRERFCTECGRPFVEDQKPADGQHLCPRCRRQETGNEQ